MTEKRTFYLHDIPLDEAWARLNAALAAAGLDAPFPGETVPLDRARGRVTAGPVWAKLSAPHYHAAAMDGYAVRAADTFGASEVSPVSLHEVSPGDAIDAVARPALPVNTGQPMPAWADAVVMIEYIQPKSGSELGIRAPVAPWQHVRPMGEDMVATELVLPANHTLRPVDLGALAASGHSAVSVRRRPRVAIIPTGSELVAVGEPPAPGKIIESNSLVLAAQVEAWGGIPTRWQIVPDAFEHIRAAAAEAARDHDLVLINAGSSAGTEDYTARVVEELGELLVHGIAVRPGHPVILGMLQPVPVIGVPGYPVSAALTGELFVEPLLARWRGQQPEPRPTLQAVLSRKVLSPTGDDEFMRVTVGQVGDQTIAAPLSRGAGVITSLVRADGLVHIPRFSEGHPAGATVTVRLYKSLDAIARTVVAIGSHDLTLDLLAQYLAERNMSLSSANVGSVGGLLALRRGQAHIAGAHLLDPETGEYNVKYVKQYLPDRHVFLVTLVEREQGLIVPPGNPQGIASVADLARGDVRYINRQRGAGTRLLLDYELEQRGVAPEQVAGYAREAFTHLEVAAAVAGGAADCGMGVLAAARALELDFVPVAGERYDLVIPAEHYTSDHLKPLRDLLHNRAFQAAVAAMPGYAVNQMGQVAAEVKP
ncbi:MAG: molybdopterin biosynthesis protein [Anaerolineae bacterium]|nr:molybdopterin biosynthesis protein [Anaerolineae bacterium]